MLNVIVADDEPAGRLALTRLISRNSNLKLSGEAASAAAAIRLIECCQPDVAFLDIEMTGGNGFSVVAGMARPPKLVFVTAHANYAAQAFDVEAVDFLLKPVEPQRFMRTVRRLQKLLVPSTAERPPMARHTELVPIPVTGGQRLLPANDILAVLADGDDSRLLLTGNAELRARRPIGAFSGSLPNPPFQRLGRSLILNLESLYGIRTISRDTTYIALRGHSQTLQLGRNATAMLRRQLAQL